jgi:2'-hydroxyisoflavone reductase
MIEPSGEIVAVAYGEKYGGLKARCEATVNEEMPGRTLSIRAGLIVGPNDYTDRFTYWVRRIAEGGEVLAPGSQDQPVQFVDVRDLADWIVRMAENRQTGTYNATGPDRKMTMLEMLETFRNSFGGDSSLTWVGEEFLKKAEVKGWTEIPLWLPSEDNIFNFFSVDCQKAIQSGLSFRPLAETARDTLEWDKARTTELRAGLSREREVELLRAWRENQ